MRKSLVHFPIYANKQTDKRQGEVVAGCIYWFLVLFYCSVFQKHQLNLTCAWLSMWQRLKGRNVCIEAAGLAGVHRLY